MEGRRVPKSLFVLLTCGLLAFGALVMLVRMPRPEDPTEEDSSDSPMLAALTANSPPGGRRNDKGPLLKEEDAVCRSKSCIETDILREPAKPDDPFQLNQAKDFFKACISTGELEKVGLKPVFQMLQLYGGWPILSPPGTWNATNFNWWRSMADLKRMFGTSSIFDIVVNQHLSNPNFSTVHLQQPSLFLSRPYYINKNNFPSYLTAFKELIVNIVKELKSSPAISSFPNLSGPLNLKYIEAKAAEIVAFEEEIAKLSRDGVETQYGLRNFTATLTLNYLQAIFNNYTTPNSTNKVCKDHIINGPMLFRKILKIIMLKPSCIMDIKLELKKLLDFTFRTAGTTISETQLVSMSDTNYMGNMFELLSTTPVEVLANYLHFRMLSWVVSGTTAAMRGHIHKYQRVVYGITEPSPRSLYDFRDYVCASSTEEKFGLALTQPYLNRVKIGNDVVEKAADMMEQVRKSFIQLLDSAKWMNSSLKGSLRKKARTITPCIGFAPWMSPNGSEFDRHTFQEHLNNHFAGLNIGNGGYLQKLWNVRAWLTDQKLKLLKERFVPGCKWTTFPGQIGAFYDIRRQAVNVPLGLLQAPFFYDGVPIAVNYGGLGSILGHEFTHGFTVYGWTETTSGKFSPISQCLIDQYNRFKVPEANLHIHGALTLDENFPDNGGLLEAYKTFKTFAPKTPQKLPGMTKFSQEQLFFIGFANEFVDAWNCPVGSPMNPQKYKKCSAFN
ncbi:Neprilysin [Folsomia candida]|uniref:Neprilysin n=1 Tax=Folsomia candida TaxID=158441 RepID=A0A226E1E1_FOLCA|nr:Neprilysin [Folsomia candida]